MHFTSGLCMLATSKQGSIYNSYRMQDHLYTHFIKRAARFWLVSCFFVVKQTSPRGQQATSYSVEVLSPLPSSSFKIKVIIIIIISCCCYPPTSSLQARLPCVCVRSLSSTIHPIIMYSPTLNDQIIPFRRSF